MGAFYSPPTESNHWGVRDPDTSGSGPNMSSNRLWNPAWGSDMSGPWDLTRDKVERSDMPGQGGGHVQEWLLEPRSGVE
jgi:hypothetical protein